MRVFLFRVSSYKSRRVLILLFTWLLVSAPLFGQGPPALSDCEKLFRQVCQKVSQAGQSFPEGKVMHVTYRSEMYYHTSGKKPPRVSQTELDIYTGDHLIYYQGKEIISMQDKKQIVSILPQAKQILVGKSDFQALKKQYGQQWRQVLQDSLLVYSRLTSCEDQVLAGKTVRKMIFDILPAKEIKTGMRQMIFWIDTELNTARQIEIIHQQGGPVEKTRLSFSEPKWIALSDAIPASAAALAWDRQGKLLPAYKDYKIVRANK